LQAVVRTVAGDGKPQVLLSALGNGPIASPLFAVLTTG
jgi:hypothetical protein